MTLLRFPRLATVALAILAATPILLAAPQDHLAPIPQATKEEAEVISLLEIGSPQNQTSNQITLPIYNPTKYVLKSCVVRILVPSQKINRIYSSEQTTILPNTDGRFSIQTSISNSDIREMKAEILKLTYEPVKK